MNAISISSMVFVLNIRSTHNSPTHLLVSLQKSLLIFACARIHERELKVSMLEQAFARVPGYTGFLPESYANPRVISQATDHTSADQKNCRLFTLHQLRNFMPGTAIFVPRDATNLMDEPKGRAGTTTAFNVSSRQDLCFEWLRSRFVSTRHSRMRAADGLGHVRTHTCRARTTWLFWRTTDRSRSSTAAKMVLPPFSNPGLLPCRKTVSKTRRDFTGYCALLKACRASITLRRLPTAGKM